LADDFLDLDELLMAFVRPPDEADLPGAIFLEPAVLVDLTVDDLERLLLDGFLTVAWLWDLA
jgi:hypothetical protein